MQSLDEQLHVAELAGLAVYARAVLSRAISDEPEVVSLRLFATANGHHADLDVEVIGAQGVALRGFGL
jgi:hypothetical protein